MAEPHDILGVTRNANAAELRKARRILLYDLHPDRLPKDIPEAAAKIINDKILEINCAYEELIKQFESTTDINSETKATEPQDQDPQSTENSKSTNQNRDNHHKSKQKAPAPNPVENKNSNYKLEYAGPFSILKKAFLKCSDGGGVDWGLAYLCTLALPDFISAVNAGYWKSEPADSIIELLQIFLAVPLFVMLINLWHRRRASDRIWRRSFLVVMTSLLTFLVTAIGLIFLIVPGVIAAKNYFYAPFIASSNCCGPIEAMKRSVEYSRFNGWSSLGVSIALSAITGGISYCLTYYLLPAFTNDVARYMSSYGAVFLNSYVNSIVLCVFGYSMLNEAFKATQRID